MKIIGLPLCLSTTTACLSLVVLSACSSGGMTDPRDFTTTQAALSEASDLLDAAMLLDNTAQSGLPTGSVAYSGVVGIGSASTDLDILSDVQADPLFAVGRMTLNVDFATTEVTGTSDNFIDGNNNQINGSLDFDASTVLLGGGNPGLRGQLTGELFPVNGDTYTYDVPISGGFLGDNAETIAAIGEGDFDLDPNNQADALIPFSVVIVAQQ